MHIRVEPDQVLWRSPFRQKFVLALALNLQASGYGGGVDQVDDHLIAFPRASLLDDNCACFPEHGSPTIRNATPPMRERRWYLPMPVALVAEETGSQIPRCAGVALLIIGAAREACVGQIRMVM